MVHGEFLRRAGLAVKDIPYLQSRVAAYPFDRFELLCGRCGDPRWRTEGIEEDLGPPRFDIWDCLEEKVLPSSVSGDLESATAGRPDLIVRFRVSRPT
jgi:hypothetical protein